MAQRSYSNDRYRKDAKIGSTRKSAAKAKPVRKQGSVEVSSSSSKPKKKAPDKDWSGLPTSPEIKKWRRIWWALLLGGLALIAVGYLVPELRDSTTVQRFIAAGVLAASMVAVSIDIFVIRRLRKQLIEAQGKKKSGKGEQAAQASKGAKAAEKASKGAKPDDSSAGDRQ